MFDCYRWSRFVLFLMIRLPPSPTCADTLLPYPTLCRSEAVVLPAPWPFGERAAGQLLAVLVGSDGPGAAWDGCQQQRAFLLLQGLRRQGPAFLGFRHLNRPAQAPGVEIIEIVSGAEIGRAHV